MKEGRKDGQTEGRKEGRKDRKTEGRKEGRKGLTPFIAVTFHTPFKAAVFASPSGSERGKRD